MVKSTIYQLAKAHQNIFKDGVQKTEGKFFKVRSTTDRRRKYRTTAKSCSCIGFAYRGHCSHITALRVMAVTGGLNN